MRQLSRREVLVGSLAGCAILTRGSVARAAPPNERVLIPAGPFLKGTSQAQAWLLAERLGVHPSWLSSEVPQQELWLPAFEIDRYPVTNRRYLEFCTETGRPAPEGWGGSLPPLGTLDQPVVTLNRADARAFAAWEGCTLPTEAQWEKAARGTDGRLFPWGNGFDRSACNYDRGGAAPPPGLTDVDAHPLGASPYGVEDMAGNAAEWCIDGPAPGNAWVKGGAWITASLLDLRCAARGLSGAVNNPLDFVGFRCVREV